MREEKIELTDRVLNDSVSELTLLMEQLWMTNEFIAPAEIKMLLRRYRSLPSHERHPLVNKAIAEVRDMENRMC